MATKAVAVRRTRTVVVSRRRGRSRSRSFSSGGVSIAVALAALSGGVGIMQAYSSGGPRGAWQAAIAGYTGYQPWSKTWDPFNSWTTRMLWPLVGAVILHALANRTGINRAVKRFIPLPVSI